MDEKLSQSVNAMRTLPIPASHICEMEYSVEYTRFTLWSPVADCVCVNFYPLQDGGQMESRHKLGRNADGTWSADVRGNHKGKFFTFQVRVNGRWLQETPGIFAKAVGVNGTRAQIIDMNDTNPDGWSADKRPLQQSFSDIILYEMHHRDFSVDEESGITNKGKFLSLTESGTRSIHGLATGLDHLKELGITHVHLLPSFDFGSVNEAQTYLRDNLLATSISDSTCANGSVPPAQYNWGYDPVNYNVPEGSYSTNPYEPQLRIREFKQMVMSLHKAGIRVVLDVVYNHVYDAAKSQFERTVPGYFFRHKTDGSLSNGSGCGNETASEMPMMRKFMVESVLYWIKEYHVDGFRFDLMGIHDIVTMNAIRNVVNAVEPTIFIYGEGWAASSPALCDAELATKGNVSKMPVIAAFGDEMRDGLRGVWNDDAKGAFLTGNHKFEESVKFGIVGAIAHPQIDMSKVNYSSIPWAKEPYQMISYVSCHDDLCIVDRLRRTLSCNSSTTPTDEDEVVRLLLLAETAVLTSQGVPFIWCGDEIARDRKGVRNAYKSSDHVNAIQWTNKSRYYNVFSYVRTLIAMRKQHPVFHMGKAEAVCANLEFLPYKGANVIAYRLKGRAVGDTWHSVIVVLNSRRKPVRVSVPKGEYTIVACAGKADLSGLFIVKGKTITVPAQSALIAHQ